MLVARSVLKQLISKPLKMATATGKLSAFESCCKVTVIVPDLVKRSLPYIPSPMFRFRSTSRVDTVAYNEGDYTI